MTVRLVLGIQLELSRLELANERLGEMLPDFFECHDAMVSATTGWVPGLIFERYFDPIFDTFMTPTVPTLPGANHLSALTECMA